MRRWIRREQGRRRRRNGRYLLGIMCTQPSWTCIERNVLLICGSVHEKSWGQCGYDSHIIFQTCLEMLHIKNVPKLTAIKQRSETALKTIINSWAASLHQASIAKQHWRRSSIHEQLAFINEATYYPPFVFPDLVDLHKRKDQIGTQDARHDHSIHDLVLLLIQAAIHHHHHVLLPLRHNLFTLLLVLVAELDARLESLPIWLLPELLLQSCQIRAHRVHCKRRFREVGDHCLHPYLSYG